jgi:alanine racemase
VTGNVARVTHSTRPNRAVVDLAAIRANTRAVIEAVRPAAVIAAVKADAYGYGAVAVAHAAAEAGAIGTATGDFESALALRASGLQGLVLVFPGAELGSADLDKAAAAGITLAVHDADTLEAWASTPHRPLDVFMKIALGLERLGIDGEQAAVAAQRIESCGRLRLGGLLGHLHAPATVSDPYVQWQLDRFSRAMDGLERAGLLPRIRVVAATGALLRRAGLRFDARLNAVDPGSLLLGMRGLDGEFRNKVRSALVRISSRILQVRSVSRDEFADTAPFPIRPSMRLGVLPMGRADGFSAIHAGRVLVRERSAPVLRIWTEHAAIDLTDNPEARAGDEAVLYGTQGAATITMDDFLKMHGDGWAHDLTMLLAPSVRREYLGASETDTAIAGGTT